MPPRKFSSPGRAQEPVEGVLYRWLSEAAERGTDRAIVYRDTYLSWHGLVHRVDRRAAELAAMEIRAGDWVGLMLGNVPDLVILSLAASKLGAVVVPLDPTLGSRDLDVIFTHAPLRALVTRPRGGESAPASAPPARAERVADDHFPEARRRLQGTLLGCAIYPRRAPAPISQLEAVLFTSGRAGESKGVARTAEILEATVEGARHAFGVDAQQGVLAAVPLFQGYGFDLGLALALGCGGTLVLEDEFNAKRMAKAFREHRVALCPGTPSMYDALLQIPNARPLQTPGARFLCGGSALDPALAERFHHRWGVRLISCYHTTEAGLVSIDLRGLNPDSVGKPMPGVRLRAGDGRRDEGPLWVSSPTVAPVVAGPSRGRADPIGGVDLSWLRTGDLGRIDRNGRVTLTGREDDLVRVDGRRVALGEVEACIESFPKVAAARAELENDRFCGAVVVADVVSSCDCAPEEIIDHCARNLASHKVPRRVRFVKQLSA